MDPILEELKVWAAQAAKWAFAWAVAEYVSIPAAIYTLVWFMAVDFGAGLGIAWSLHTMDSRVAKIGLTRKALTLLILLVIHKLEVVLGTEMGLEKAGAIGYTVAEAVSIIEKCDQFGVPIPDPSAAVAAPEPQEEIAHADEAPVAF